MLAQSKKRTQLLNCSLEKLVVVVRSWSQSGEFEQLEWTDFTEKHAAVTDSDFFWLETMNLSSY